LTVTRSIDPNIYQALVPQFLLQPLLENALEHGIATTSGAGTVHISADSKGDQLEIAVTDSGRGGIESSLSGRKNQGLGLGNTRLRLEQLYGRDQSISLEKVASGGTRVAVSMPLRFSTAQRAAQVPSVA
jgi:two-component system, LytTR family, sensor kinase